MPNPEIYKEFYQFHRIQLKQKIHDLSGALSPRTYFIEPRLIDKWILLTNSGRTKMMGGGYLWIEEGTWKHPISNNPIPIFTQVSQHNVGEIHPILRVKQIGEALENQKQPVLQFSERFPKLGHLKIDKDEKKIEFFTDEDLSEKIGGGLIESGSDLSKLRKGILIDITGNGYLDFIFGTNDWSQYFPRVNENGNERPTRWGDEKYRPFDENGKWRGGPLIGELYVCFNLGEDPDDPEIYKFSKAVKVPQINQYGNLTFVCHDFTGNGQWDIIATDFLESITFYRNLQTQPINPDNPQFNFAKGVPIQDPEGNPIKSPAVINFLVSADINQNGYPDLIFSGENGYIYLCENACILSEDSVPVFYSPVRLKQNNPPAKADVLAVPTIGELRQGKLDMIAGTAGGYFDYFEDIQDEKIFSKGRINSIPRILPPDPEKGSIQGPSEMGWGYTAPTLFDWNQNGLLDLIFSDINGEHSVSLNIGNKNEPKFDKPFKLLKVEDDLPLTTVWRVKPVLIRVENSVYYLCLDEDAKLSIYKKIDNNHLEKVGRARTPEGEEINFILRWGGARGRDKLEIFDWDGDGVPDLLVGTPRDHNITQYKKNKGLKLNNDASVLFLKGVSIGKDWVFEAPKYIKSKKTNTPLGFGTHSCAPAVYETNGKIYLVIGAEDGQFYRFSHDELYY